MNMMKIVAVPMHPEGRKFVAIFAAVSAAGPASANFAVGASPPPAAIWAIIALASALKSVSSVMVPLPSLFRLMVAVCSRQEEVNSASRAAPMKLRVVLM